MPFTTGFTLVDRLYQKISLTYTHTLSLLRFDGIKSISETSLMMT